MVGCCRLRGRRRRCRAATLGHSCDQHRSGDWGHRNGDLWPADITEPHDASSYDDAHDAQPLCSLPEHNACEAEHGEDDHAGQAHVDSDTFSVHVRPDDAVAFRVQPRAEPGGEQRRSDDPGPVRVRHERAPLADTDRRADGDIDADRWTDIDADRLGLPDGNHFGHTDRLRLRLRIRELEPDVHDHPDRERQCLGDDLDLCEPVGSDDVADAEHDSDVSRSEHDEVDLRSTDVCNTDVCDLDFDAAVADRFQLRPVHPDRWAGCLCVLACDERLVRGSGGIAVRPLSLHLPRTGLAASVAVLVLVGGCARVPAGPVTPSASAASSPTVSVTSASAMPPSPSASASATGAPSSTAGPSTPPKPAADKRKGSQLDEPYTVGGVIVVSKAHPVSARYGPPHPTAPYHLDAPAAKALAKMTAAARKAGVRIVVRSGYRSYATQKAVYERALRNYPSEASAKAYNAPPGASEHQTGLSMDLWDGVTWSLPMANTATGKWLHKHCHEFGFILRYPQGKQKITGYNYEPWHFRYVGVDIAKQFPTTNRLTLEEFLGLD